MFKFLHTADIHLDSPLQGLERYEGAPVNEIRRASRRALENLIHLATDEAVAFVLIAGDLYDGDWKDYSTGLFLSAEMAKLRDAAIPAFIITGNHDAANRMTRSLRLPENVHLLSSREPETVFLEEEGVAIHGQGFARTAVTENLAASFPKALSSYFNVGLLHTSATGYEGHERYAPCSLQDLVEKGYDYWALGHIHKREVLSEDPWIVFPGIIQGRHARESGAKGCTIVEVDGGRVLQVDHRELDVIRWHTLTVDASEASSGYDVRDLFEERLATLLRDSGQGAIALRVRIVGACEAHAELSAKPEKWINEIRSCANTIRGGDVWVERVLLQTSQPPMEPALYRGTSAVGELFQFIEELQTDDNRLVELANELEPLRKKLPPELRDGDGVGSPRQIRVVLDGVRHLLASKLLSEN